MSERSGDSMIISILLSTHKRTDLLAAVLPSLTRQTVANCAIEIIILDDCFVADEQCRQLAITNNVRYIHTGSTKTKDEWRIPGFAFNIGVKQCTGDIVFLSGSEIWHHGDTLQPLCDALVNHPKNISVPRVLDDNTKGRFLKAIQQGNAQSATSVGGALRSDLPFFMGFHKQEYYDIGGYDEDFTGVCYDDDDFIDRMRANGGKVVPNYAVTTVHLYHERHAYKTPEISVRWEFNKNLYDTRKGIVQRNVGREWGVM